MQHTLKINSLHDGMAECSCGGWHYIGIGEKSREEIQEWHDKHLEPHKENEKEAKE